MTTDTYEPPLWIVAYWRVREAFGEDFVKTSIGREMVHDMIWWLTTGGIVILRTVKGDKCMDVDHRK